MMRDDGFNPGSPPTSLRNVLEIAEEAETQLQRAERALFLARGCDRSVTAEPLAETPK